MLNIYGFLNEKRYKEVLVWDKETLGGKPRVVLAGRTLNSFSIKNARTYKLLEAEEKEECMKIYCCDSISLQFNKLENKFLDILREPDFNIFEIGFVYSSGFVARYRIPLGVLKKKWKECTEVIEDEDFVQVVIKNIKKSV